MNDLLDVCHESQGCAFIIPFKKSWPSLRLRTTRDTGHVRDTPALRDPRGGCLMSLGAPNGAGRARDRGS